MPKGSFGNYGISFAGRQETLENVFGKEKLKPGAMNKALWEFIKKYGLASKGK